MKKLKEYIGRLIRYTYFTFFTQKFLLIFFIKSDFWRSKLNRFYNTLCYEEKSHFHHLFSTVFKDRKNKIDFDGFWTVSFVGKSIKLPLREESMWLDWDTAISILGHDIEIKATYEALIQSIFKPQCFVDIGANYGTHTLLFASAGIKATAFEPNINCKPYLDYFLATNKLVATTENIAIGDIEQTAILRFPEQDTWLGSISLDTQKNLSQSYTLTEREIKVMPLDTYIKTHDVKPDLIKIDTEGFESNVIKGAKETLLQFNPLVIFESNEQEKREELFDLFYQLRYGIYVLPILLNQKPNRLDKIQFCSHKQTNFMAISQSHLILKK